jgi:cytochrome c biogenesis protein
MNDDNELQQPRSAREPSLVEVTWRTLKSTRTALYVLIIIAAVATVGELIPQGEPRDFYAMKYTENSVALITQLGLDRLYTSNLFYLLLLVLMLNLTACAGRAWRRARIMYRGPGIAAAQRLKVTDDKALRATIPPDAVALAASAALRQHGYRVTEERGPAGEVWMVALKHRFAALGTVLTHYSIFVLAAGAIMGSIAATSLDTNFVINEGETFHDDKQQVDFDIALTKFDMEYHPDGGSVSKYASDLVVTRAGQQLAAGTIAVNRPLNVEGVRLYQSSWGLGGFTLKITSPTGERRELFVRLQEGVGDAGDRAWKPVPDGNSTVTVWFTRLSDNPKIVLIAPDFAPDALTENGQIVGSKSEYPRNPAVLLQGMAAPMKSDQHGMMEPEWLTAAKPVRFHGYKIELGRVTKWSGVGVRRDMGLPLVWLGFIALMVGLMLQLYTQPRTALVNIMPQGGGARVAVAVRGGQVNASDSDLRSLTEAVTGAVTGAATTAKQS